MGKVVIGLAATAVTNGSIPAAGVNRSYIDAVMAAGGLPVLLPIGQRADAADAVAAVDGLLLCGGGDVDPGMYGAAAGPEVYGVDQARDRWELALATAARHAGVPVFGICRGAQILNVAAGGTLVDDVPTATGMNHRDLPRDHEFVHEVIMTSGSLLATICGSTRMGVNTLHHQAISEVGRGLQAVAWAPDGTVEAVEPTGGWSAIGVQWHPELLGDHPAQRALFSWLMSAAQAHRLPRRAGLSVVLDEVSLEPVSASLEPVGASLESVGASLESVGAMEERRAS